MEYEAIIQTILDEIDKRITENIRTVELARIANYSVYHFCRVFMTLTGTPVLAYITRRKLEYALYDLSQGKKIIDVAMEYGYETHAGFTKAFRKCYGYPPSLHRLHIPVNPPEKVTIESVRLKHGGTKMQVQIKELKPQTVIGYPSRHRMPGVSRIADIPVFWENTNLEYEAALTTLHDTYVKSNHCEISVCFDVDEENDFFTYMLGVGVDESEVNIPKHPGIYLHKVQGGLFAVFTTPLVDENMYTDSIQDTWKQILSHWLPESKYEYDDTRTDYEYYDERDHSWLHDGKSSMDICIPIRERK